jgi:hypothetical protein
MIRKQNVIGIILAILIMLGSGAAISPVFGDTTSEKQSNRVYEITIRYANTVDTYGGCRLLEIGNNIIKINYNGSIVYIPIYSIVKMIEEDKNE